MHNFTYVVHSWKSIVTHFENLKIGDYARIISLSTCRGCTAAARLAVLGCGVLCCCCTACCFGSYCVGWRYHVFWLSLAKASSHDRKRSVVYTRMDLGPWYPRQISSWWCWRSDLKITCFNNFEHLWRDYIQGLQWLMVWLVRNIFVILHCNTLGRRKNRINVGCGVVDGCSCW